MSVVLRLMLLVEATQCAEYLVYVRMKWSLKRGSLPLPILLVLLGNSLDFYWSLSVH